MNNTAAEKLKYEDFAFGFIDSNVHIASNGSWFKWSGTHYDKEPNPKHRLRRFFISEKIPQKNSLVDNVLPIVETLITTDRRLPCWHDGRRETLLPFRNGLLNFNSAHPTNACLVS